MEETMAVILRLKNLVQNITKDISDSQRQQVRLIETSVKYSPKHAWCFLVLLTLVFVFLIMFTNS